MLGVRYRREREDLTMVDNVLWDAITSNDSVLDALLFIFSGVK
ncbi:hypothetical protein ABLE94_11895 [Gordonia sp. VNK1]